MWAAALHNSMYGNVLGLVSLYKIGLDAPGHVHAHSLPTAKKEQLNSQTILEHACHWSSTSKWSEEMKWEWESVRAVLLLEVLGHKESGQSEYTLVR